MRTIKFRAWCEGKHENMTFTEAHMDYEVTIKNGMYAEVESGWDIHGTYPTIPIMQFTGLKDKNGKEIYEGDIVKYYGYDYSEDGDFEYYKVEFTKECYGEKWGWDLVDIKGNAHEYYYGGFNAENCVVIGNIHSNPEILK